MDILDFAFTAFYEIGLAHIPNITHLSDALVGATTLGRSRPWW
jgi:hypothetical protein